MKKWILGLIGWLLSTVIGWIGLPTFMLLLIIVVAASALGQSGQSSSSSGWNTNSSGSPSTRSASTTGNSPQQWTGVQNKGMVAAALKITPYLFNGPPHGLDQWYSSDLPGEVLTYWQSVCPGCWYWTNGKLQCVMLIIAAAHLAQQDLPIARDASTFWPDYANLPGWREIANGGADGPVPGDIVVFSGGDKNLGHVAIVVDVVLPTDNAPGSVVLAGANQDAPLQREMLSKEGTGSLVLHAHWPGYAVLGYIRHSRYVA